MHKRPLITNVAHPKQKKNNGVGITIPNFKLNNRAIVTKLHVARTKNKQTKTTDIKAIVINKKKVYNFSYLISEKGAKITHK